MPEPPPRIVDWYRADPWPRMRRVLIAGPCGVAAGGLVVASSFVARPPLDLRVAATIVGLALVLAGVGFTMARMYRILRDDSSLTLRTDGVCLHAAGIETLVLWDDLTGARWDGVRGELLLDRRGAPALVVDRAFAPARGPEVAAAIARTQRKAAMNLLA